MARRITKARSRRNTPRPRRPSSRSATRPSSSSKRNTPVVRGPQLDLEHELGSRPIENHPAIRPSKNELERNAGNKGVVSIRLSVRKLAALDRVVAKRNELAHWRRVKRTEVIEAAIDELLAKEED